MWLTKGTIVQLLWAFPVWNRNLLLVAVSGLHLNVWFFWIEHISFPNLINLTSSLVKCLVQICWSKSASATLQMPLYLFNTDTTRATLQHHSASVSLHVFPSWLWLFPVRGPAEFVSTGGLTSGAVQHTCSVCCHSTSSINISYKHNLCPCLRQKLTSGPICERLRE